MVVGVCVVVVVDVVVVTFLSSSYRDSLRL